MKKISLILALLLLLCSFSLLAVACGEKHQLTVIDPSNLLIEPLKDNYKAGETVTVKVFMVDDADIVAYLDGQDLGKYEVVETNGEYTHWEFHFNMPDHDATLTLETKGGLLPPPDGDQEYSLTVVDPSNLLIEPLKDNYKAGETVIVKVNILMDADVIAYLDGQNIGKYEVIETNGEYTHWEFHFTMPDHDATLTFEIKDGFLPNENDGFLPKEGNEYNLTVIDPSNLLVEPLKASYKASEIVTVKVDILMDAYVVVYLDGQPCEENVTDGNYDYWEFYFIMPDHDATLTFEIKDGFLP